MIKLNSPGNDNLHLRANEGHILAPGVTMGETRSCGVIPNGTGLSEMSIDGFWTVVERVHDAAPQDMRAKCKLLEQELKRLPLNEVLSFERHFGECYCRANKWDIWGAAYLIHRGCSDDGFMDFRSTLISLGRRAFEAAITDADSLADFDISREWACFEGYQYVASKVYREVHNYEPPENTDPSQYPHGPTGEHFDEEEMTPRFPRLVAKYGHKDTNPEVLKAKRARSAKYEEMSELVRTILLHGIIPKYNFLLRAARGLTSRPMWRARSAREP